MLCAQGGRAVPCVLGDFRQSRRRGKRKLPKRTKLAPPRQSGSSLPGAALPTAASTPGVHLPGKTRKGGKGETVQVRKTLGEKHPVLQVTSGQRRSVGPYTDSQRPGLKLPRAPTGLPSGWQSSLGFCPPGDSRYCLETGQGC